MHARAVVVCLLAVGCGQFGLYETVVVEPKGRIDIEPEGQVDFGELVPKSESVLQNFVLGAATDEPVEIVDAWLEGDTDAFVVVGEPSLPHTFEPGQHVGVRVRFRAPDDGTFRATFYAESGTGQRFKRGVVGRGCRDQDRNKRCD